MTRVAVQQLAPILGDVEGNRALALAAIREATEAGADVVVLPGADRPRATCSPRARRSPRRRSAATTRSSASGRRRPRRADAVIVAGFCERGDDGEIYNSAALLDAGGLRAVYRKLHLWDGEKLLFAPGRARRRRSSTRASAGSAWSSVTTSSSPS